VHAVLASTAQPAWNKLRAGVVDRLSVVPTGDPDDWNLRRRGGGLQWAGSALVSVDLVRRGADPNALVVAAWSDLTPAELEVQRRIDEWLADPLSPWPLEFLERAVTAGVAAMNPLAELVEPLLQREAVVA
jgi:hypothetical protein